MEKHSNLSIVVTGGASGIGAAVCKSLYEQGAVIGIIDIDVNAGESLCRALGDRAFFSAGDRIPLESLSGAEITIMARSGSVIDRSLEVIERSGP